jgi:hypothetical protein
MEPDITIYVAKATESLLTAESEFAKLLLRLLPGGDCRAAA